MIPQIAKAMSKGFSANQIVNFLLRKFPNHKDAIEKALAAGFTADQVIRYLSRDSGQKLEEPEINTSYSRMRDKDIKRKETSQNAVLGGLGALGAAPFALNALAGMNAPNTAMAMQHAMPNQIKAMTPALTGQSPQQMLQQLPSQPPISPTPQAPIAPSPVGQAPTVAQPPITPQAINPQRDIKKSVDILQNLGEVERVKNLINGGLPTKDIAGVLKAIMPKDKYKVLESQEGGVEALIDDLQQSLQATEQVSSEAIIQPPIENQELTPQETAIEQAEIAPEEIEPPKPIAKNDVVSSPDGIGTVKEIRNGQAIVEVDGKLKKVDESDLEPPAFTDNEIADAYDNLMAKIPEPERSAFISWAGYDENTRILGYIPRGGKYEELTDITPEEAELIRTGKGVARTSGERTEGIWVVGGDTRGLISQIQHDRRRVREAQEAKQLKLGLELPKKEKEERGGMKPLFDEMAYAREKSEARKKKAALEAREAKKKAKEEEKARLKREKDEAKKRKKQA